MLQEQWKLQAALKMKEAELQRQIKRHDSFEGASGSKSLIDQFEENNKIEISKAHEQRRLVRQGKAGGA